MQVVVLAGGLATRMHPETLQVPKSLLPISGRPFIDWQLERLAACGAKSVVLCLGHLADELEAHVQSGRHHGLVVRYSRDGEVLLGTGGALRRALPLLEPEFVLTYGDSYLPFDYAAPLADLREHPEALGTMSVFANENRLEPGNVERRGEWVARYRKGQPAPELDHIDYGAIALRRSLFTDIENGAVFGVEVLLDRLSRRNQLRAFLVNERFYETGSVAGRSELERYLNQQFAGKPDREGGAGA